MEIVKLKKLSGNQENDASSAAPGKKSAPNQTSTSNRSKDSDKASVDSKSFGRGVTTANANKKSPQMPDSSKLRGKSNSSTKVVPKGDSRSKFAKSLFGNVKDKKTSK